MRSLSRSDTSHHRKIVPSRRGPCHTASLQCHHSSRRSKQTNAPRFEPKCALYTASCRQGVGRRTILKIGAIDVQNGVAPRWSGHRPNGDDARLVEVDEFDGRRAVEKVDRVDGDGEIYRLRHCYRRHDAYKASVLVVLATLVDIAPLAGTRPARRYCEILCFNRSQVAENAALK